MWSWEGTLFNEDAIQTSMVSYQVAKHGLWVSALAPSQPPLPNQFPENLSLVTFWNFHCNWPSAGDTAVGLDDRPGLLTGPFPNLPFACC